MSNSNIEKRFGVVAVEKGYITADQLHEAMKIQLDEDLYGRPHRLIGQILLEKGYISSTQIKEVLVAMGWPKKLMPIQFRHEAGLDTPRRCTK